MPLSCDCYPGCWRDHSDGWPSVINGKLADELWRYNNVKGIVPYGSCVLIGTRTPTAKQTHPQLRVEQEEILNKLLASYFAERKDQE